MKTDITKLKEDDIANLIVNDLLCRTFQLSQIVLKMMMPTKSYDNLDNKTLTTILPSVTVH